jgi:hypothetical protein
MSRMISMKGAIKNPAGEEFGSSLFLRAVCSV